MKEYDLEKAFRDVRSAQGAKDKAGETVKLMAKTAFNIGNGIVRNWPQYKERFAELEQERKKQDANSAANGSERDIRDSRPLDQSERKYTKKEGVSMSSIDIENKYMAEIQKFSDLVDMYAEELNELFHERGNLYPSDSKRKANVNKKISDVQRKHDEASAKEDAARAALETSRHK